MKMVLKSTFGFWFFCFISVYRCQGLVMNEVKGVPVNKDGSLPNFVIMMMDDLGWGDLGSNGEPNRETPNIDQMAREGMTAISMYASNPLCSPSRASLLTGRLPIRNGFYTSNMVGRNSYTPQNIMGGIPKTEILLQEVLKEQNYTSALIGKWHFGHREEYLPVNRGFDYFFGTTNCHFGPYDNIHTPNIPVFRNNEMVGRLYEEYEIDRSNFESNLTKLYTAEAVQFIQQQKNGSKPFFLYWAPDATHAPTYASKDFLKSSKRGAYGDAVKELDHGVGAIINALKESGFSNNTLVVFTSDNGAALVSKFQGGSNGPFLCGKQTTFEGGMRVPGIFYWPGIIKPGSTSQVWTHMDIFSTLIELAWLDLPSDRLLDGIPLARSLWNSKLEFLRPVFYYRGNRLMAVRQGSYKMHLWTWNTTPEELKNGIDFCPGQRTDNITTSVPFDHRRQPLLYNLDIDPGEKYPIKTSDRNYRIAVTNLMTIINEHENELIPSDPQLNWCDDAVMHWSPPGCQKLKSCLKSPQSDPYLCDWPH